MSPSTTRTWKESGAAWTCCRRPERRRGALVALLLLASVWAAPARAVEDDTLYMVAVSHLDTQWLWTIQETIARYVPQTFEENFARLDEYPWFRFGWEGSFRYALLAEYYPELWERLQDYVAEGRWLPAGTSVDAGDVIVPSPEALIRQFLYGTLYFERELGIISRDVFLPDCFGFGWALPSVAAHCGLVGFSTQKLGWGSAAGIPFPIGQWEGPDGARIVAALDAGSYVTEIEHDLSADPYWIETVARQKELSGLGVAYGYFGVGDRGGAASVSTFDWLDRSIHEGAGPLQVVSATPEQLYHDLTPAQKAALPVHRSELVMTQHGTGSYTSQCALKRWNRHNELLGDTAERAAVAADWLGALPYPRARLQEAWERFLWHQFHDDLPGTGIPQIYPFTWNDLLLSLGHFAGVLTTSVGGLSRGLDTRGEGLPLIVFNPLSVAREDVVEALVRFPGAAPAHFRVLDAEGREVPAQVLAREEGALEIAFLAAVPSVGAAVFHVLPAETAPAAGELSVDEGHLENARYRVELDAQGDIARVHDKALGRELLAAPLRTAFLQDWSFVWPAWEIGYADLQREPLGHLADPVSVEVVERGPARVALRVTRDWGASRFVQEIRLAAGEAGARLEVQHEVRWDERQTLAKAVFPLASANPEATWDLGLGVIARPNATETLYEVPGQQWADLSAPDGRFGVSILTDGKYGWDKPADGVLRLTLLHTPMTIMHHQDTLDVGNHRFAWALYGHEGDWRQGTTWQAARFNQPLAAFQTTAHQGALGASASFLAVDNPAVAVRAFKKAERSEELVVRLQELAGAAHEAVRVRFPGGFTALRELYGTELPLEGEAAAARLEDGELVVALGPFQPRTFALTPGAAPAALTSPTSRPLALPFDLDVVSFDEDREDGRFDEQGLSVAGELFPAELLHEGVRFTLGPTTPGAPNALTCAGQRLPLEAAPGEVLHLLVAARGDVEATFRVGEHTERHLVPDISGFVGQWDSEVVDGQVVLTLAEMTPAYFKDASVAWVGTHRHRSAALAGQPGGDNEPYVFTYLFKLTLPVPEGADALVLPEDPRVLLFAATLAADPHTETVPATSLHDGHEPRNRSARWALQAAPAPDEGEDQDEGGGGCQAGGGPAPWPLLLLLLALLPRRRTM